MKRAAARTKNILKRLKPMTASGRAKALKRAAHKKGKDLDFITEGGTRVSVYKGSLLTEYDESGWEDKEELQLSDITHASWISKEEYNKRKRLLRKQESRWSDRRFKKIVPIMDRGSPLTNESGVNFKKGEHLVLVTEKDGKKAIHVTPAIESLRKN